MLDYYVVSSAFQMLHSGWTRTGCRGQLHVSVQVSGSDTAVLLLPWVLTPQLATLVPSLVFGSRKFTLAACSVLGMSAGLF